MHEWKACILPGQNADLTLQFSGRAGGCLARRAWKSTFCSLRRAHSEVRRGPLELLVRPEQVAKPPHCHEAMVLDDWKKVQLGVRAQGPREAPFPERRWSRPSAPSKRPWLGKGLPSQVGGVSRPERNCLSRGSLAATRRPGRTGVWRPTKPRIATPGAALADASARRDPVRPSETATFQGITCSRIARAMKE